MQIKGPDGNVVDVDDGNRLCAFAVIQNEDKNSNIDGRYWSAYFQVTPTGADDYFFYLKNTGTKDLFITDVRISSSVPTQLFYDHVSGIAVGGSDATVTSRKLGSPKQPDAIVQSSVDFTGLTKIGEWMFEECTVAGTRYSLKLTGNIIIPQGQAIAFRRVAATGLMTCVVSIAEAQ